MLMCVCVHCSLASKRMCTSCVAQGALEEAQLITWPTAKKVSFDALLFVMVHDNNWPPLLACTTKEHGRDTLISFAHLFLSLLALHTVFTQPTD